MWAKRRIFYFNNDGLFYVLSYSSYMLRGSPGGCWQSVRCLGRLLTSRCAVDNAIGRTARSLTSATRSAWFVCTRLSRLQICVQNVRSPTLCNSCRNYRMCFLSRHWKRGSFFLDIVTYSGRSDKVAKYGELSSWRLLLNYSLVKINCDARLSSENSL